MSTYFHELKIQPEHFEAIASGAKTFEIRLNDRNFKVGDLLILREWSGRFYTGREEQKYITHILQSEFLQEGYVGLSLSNHPVSTEFSDFSDDLEDSCSFDPEPSTFLDSFAKSDSAVFGVSREGRSGAAQNRQKILYVPVTRKVSITDDTKAQKCTCKVSDTDDTKKPSLLRLISPKTGKEYLITVLD